MHAKAMDVDGYLRALPEDKRKALEAVRRIIRDVAPAAVESIAYGMPAYRYRGKPLAYFAAAKKHCAIYALPASQFREELAGFAMAKGTTRFTVDRPLPEPLLRALLAARMRDIEDAQAERATPRARAGA
jgi:uncharacterized protein YdhG (YjbR/CyaY superfamily)